MRYVLGSTAQNRAKREATAVIRSLIFDMGNVLLDYDPMRLLRQRLPERADQDAVCAALFASPEWALLDEGLIQEDAVLGAALARLPGRLHAVTRSVFADWPSLYVPIPETEQLVRDAKRLGLSCYLLSNASLRFYSYEANYPVFSLLDGRIISASFRTVKPKPEIYRALFDTFSLTPSECFFTDDLAANVEGGRRLGMDGFVLDRRQYGALRAALRAKGLAL